MALMDSLSLKAVELFYVVTVGVVLYAVTVNCAWLYLACVLVLYVCLKVIRVKSTGKIEVKGQGVFVTGCDTG